ncbi:MAG: hypothetical protein ACOX1Q_05640 [Eubacteriales bacterium]
MRKRPTQGRTFRSQAILGLLLGIGFLGFGVIKVVPEYGTVGILWTFLAVFIIVVNCRTIIQGAGNSDSATSRSGAGGDTKKDPEEDLMELYRIYNRKLITKEEYLSKREDILRDIKSTANVEENKD